MSKHKPVIYGATDIEITNLILETAKDLLKRPIRLWEANLHEEYVESGRSSRYKIFGDFKTTKEGVSYKVYRKFLGTTIEDEGRCPILGDYFYPVIYSENHLSGLQIRKGKESPIIWETLRYYAPVWNLFDDLISRYSQLEKDRRELIESRRNKAREIRAQKDVKKFKRILGVDRH